MDSLLASQSILNEVDSVVYISDLKTHELYYLNAACLRTLGNPSEDEWRRKKCYKVLQGLDAPCPFCTNDCITLDAFYNWEHYNSNLNKYFHVQDKRVIFEGVEARLEIAQDITDQRLLAQTLSRRLEEQEAIVDCISTLHTSQTPTDSINQLLEIIAQYHLAERSYICLLSPDKATISNTHEWCAPGVSPEIENLQDLDASIVDSWFEKYDTVGEFYIDSLGDELDTNSEEYKILAAQGITSLVTAPIRDTNQTAIGFIGIDDPTKNIKNTFLIRAVSNFIWDFLDKAEKMEILNRLSFYDELTGLKNRHSYRDKIVNLQNNLPPSLGVLFIDINGLKAVNDIHGHQEGDFYIQSIASILNAHFPNCTYRIGGDEFVVLAEGIPKDTFLTTCSTLETALYTGEAPLAAMGYIWQNSGPSIQAQVDHADYLMLMTKENQYSQFGGKSDIFRNKHFYRRPLQEIHATDPQKETL